MKSMRWSNVRRQQWAVALFASLALADALALPGVESYQSPVPTENCFFSPPVSSGSLWNFVYPDSNSVYQCTSFDMPEGSELTIAGQYPRARSLSWTVYGGQGGQQILDTRIEPDPGSTNPFIDGNDRLAEFRDYTIRVVQGNVPSDPTQIPPNTLFSGGPTNTPFGNLICSRIYVPDRGTEPFGDTRLPRVSVRLSNGEVLQGKRMCEAVDAGNKGFGPPKPAGFNIDTYVALRQGRPGIDPARPPTHPATNPPVFRAFFTQQHQACVFFTPEADCGNPSLDPDGVGLGNPANRYVETWVDRNFGEVLVLRAKKPRTPKTWRGTRRVPADDYDLRYFSVCPQESLASWRVGDCIFDEELPTDAQGFFTLVLSKPTYRPSNAKPSCGYAWASLPEAGDGAGDFRLSNIWIRNQLPSPNFAEAAQNVLVPGTEEQVMGDYYPRGTYMSKGDFQRNYGCPGPGK